jgi:hypothetical protein
MRPGGVGLRLLACAALIGAASGCGGSTATTTSTPPAPVGPATTATVPASTASVPTTTSLPSPVSSGATSGSTAPAPPAASYSPVDQKALTALAVPQRQPTDLDLFSSEFKSNGFLIPNIGIYPDGSPMAPDSLAAPSTAQVRAELQQFLGVTFHGDAAKVATALALFDSAALATRIPNPTVRAAFVGMSGTSFEPAIQDFTDNQFFSTITYGPLITTTVIAQSQQDPNDPSKRVVVINERYADEPFTNLVAVLGHEDQHSDNSVAPAEEAILNEETGMVEVEVLSAHPELAYVDTELTRRMNDYAMMFLNSRHPNSAQNVIVAPDGAGLYPGSAAHTAPDTWTNLHGGGTTTTPAVTATILRAILAPGTTLPSPLAFDQTAAALFENLRDPLLPPAARLRVTVLLQLTTPAEIAHVLGESTEQVISTFGLQPILDIIAKGQHPPA